MTRNVLSASGKLFAVASLASIITLASARTPTQALGARAPHRGTPGLLARDRPPVSRPGLFFEEEWKQTAKGDEHPVTAESNSDPNLDVTLYVPKGRILLTGAAGDENFPVHLWTGLCESPCAVGFRDRNHFADLSGLARIRFNTKMSGLHQVHPIVKLADGTWWLGDRETTGTARDWLLSEISFADVRWIKLDIKRVVTVGNFVDKLDLRKVDEIGFADLMPGSGHGPGGWADVAQIEVYANAVPR